MSLVHFTPFQTLDAIREHLSRSLEDSNNFTCSGSNWYLPIEITEDDSNFYLNTVAPGIDPSKISVEVENGIVTVSTEITRRELKENEKVHLSDFCYGNFKRSVKIGNNIDTENINASYKLGLVTITIPKSSKAIKKLVEIKNLD